MLGRKLVAESFGTFCLVFAGTGAAVVNEVTQGGVTHVGVALVFGLVVMALIYALGDVSGCHLNPAVTAGLVAAGRFSPAAAGPYAAAQLAGAMVASLVLRGLFPASMTLGATLPVGGVWQSCVLEFLLTFMLMAVILLVTVGPRERTIFAGVAIGAVIGLEALFAGPVSGASMNPARSLAPAVVSGMLGDVWIYCIGPLAGSLAAVPLARVLLARDDDPPDAGAGA